jgi:hypothetical protein
MQEMIPMLANPPSADAKSLVAMDRHDYHAAQQAYERRHGVFAGTLRGMPTAFAHEVRATMEGRTDLDAGALCQRFAALAGHCSRDADPWLRVGLFLALEARPSEEITPAIRSLRETVMAGRLLIAEHALGEALAGRPPALEPELEETAELTPQPS